MIIYQSGNVKAVNLLITWRVPNVITSFAQMTLRLLVIKYFKWIMQILSNNKKKRKTILIKIIRVNYFIKEI